ncbi:unnamed protein product [Paramecium sonneborni]|uniref:ZZ-type domain-containing protein n=1 Tax=Paramecium sonneborni TaxID=65129 RepID=A0A8S1QMQ0_9CILI|nr:unnamed protein product [Paramecium sonneborni]
MKIKIVYNNEIHLFKSQNPTLSDLRSHIQKIFPNIDLNFKLTYNDQENDQITLSCQEDFQVLVDEGIQTIKVFVITSQIPKSVPQDKMVHQTHTCDGCQTSPIIGSRFKCLECPDYDLCEECQVKNLHNHHQFFKISTQEELDQFRKEHKAKFCHWEQKGFGHHDHGPFGQVPFGNEASKQIKDFFRNPAFKDMKQNVCSIAKDIFKVIKTEIEKNKNTQQQQEQPQDEECNVNDKQETNQETQQEKQQEVTQQTIQNDNTNQENNCKIQQEVEEKIRTLISLLQCDEKQAREYLECFKEQSLDEIIDIILEKN